MKTLLGIGAAALCLFSAGAALADGNVSCAVPKAEWRPMLELQKTLKKSGWTVRKVQLFNGCYEVYGYDDKDKRVEAFFNPKTFERVFPKP